MRTFTTLLARTLRQALLAAVIVGTSTAVGPAQANVPRTDVRFEVGDLPVRVLAANDEQLVVEFLDHPGSRAEVPIENVPAEVRYQLAEVKADPSQRRDWVELASFAERLDLPVRRLEALQQARAIEDGPEIRQRLSEARQACAADRLERARQMRTLGELTAARSHLEETIERYPDCSAAETARGLLEELAAAAEHEGGDGDAGESTSATSPDATRRERIAGLTDQARQELQAGRRHSDDYVEATRHFEQALETLREANRMLADLPTSPDERDRASESPRHSPNPPAPGPRRPARRRAHRAGLRVPGTRGGPAGLSPRHASRRHRPERRCGQ